MGTWNYRILKQEDGNYGVHEVFYGNDWIEDGSVPGIDFYRRKNSDKIAWTETPVPEGLWAESLEELLSTIKHIYEDTLKYPVIDERKTIENGYKEIVISNEDNK